MPSTNKQPSKPKVKKSSGPKKVKSAVIAPAPAPAPAPIVETPIVDTPIVAEGNNVQVPQVPQLLNYDEEFKTINEI